MRESIRFYEVVREDEYGNAGADADAGYYDQMLLRLKCSDTTNMFHGE